MLQTIATRPRENSLFERSQRQFMLCTVRRKAAITDVCVGQTLAVERVLAPAEAAHPEWIAYSNRRAISWFHVNYLVEITAAALPCRLNEKRNRHVAETMRAMNLACFPARNFMHLLFNSAASPDHSLGGTCRDERGAPRRQCAARGMGRTAVIGRQVQHSDDQ